MSRPPPRRRAPRKPAATRGPAPDNVTPRVPPARQRATQTATSKPAARKTKQRSSTRAPQPVVDPTPRWRPWRLPLRALRAYLRAPGFLQFGIAVLLLVLLAPAVNWLYQVVRKPTELFFPVSGRLFKTPSETWRAYSPLFEAHATPIMSPTLLAALAQAEASGNPVARTYWRWQATANPFEIYRPASSAAGMFQFTDGTFDEARAWCVHDHRVVSDGPWHDWQSCWFNALYSRVIPSHAVELAASNLDRRVRETLARHGIRQASLRQQQDLAIVTHLCGAGAASRFAARGLRATPGQRCGDHPLAHYIDRVQAYARTFEGLSRRDGAE